MAAGRRSWFSVDGRIGVNEELGKYVRLYTTPGDDGRIVYLSPGYVSVIPGAAARQYQLRAHLVNEVAGLTLVEVHAGRDGEGGLDERYSRLSVYLSHHLQ